MDWVVMVTSEYLTCLLCIPSYHVTHSLKLISGTEFNVCMYCGVFFLQSPERLKLQGWQQRVEAATAKLGATFLDYDPDSGNWVFTVSYKRKIDSMSTGSCWPVR